MSILYKKKHSYELYPYEGRRGRGWGKNTSFNLFFPSRELIQVRNISHKSQSCRQRIGQLVELRRDETEESKEINKVDSLLLCNCKSIQAALRDGRD